jgi:hypothetical protein
MAIKRKKTSAETKEKVARRRARLRKLALVVGISRARKRRAAGRRAA